MKLFFLIIAIIASQITFAGTETGNGGDPAQVKYLEFIKDIISEIKNKDNKLIFRDLRKYDLDRYLDLKNVRLVYPSIVPYGDIKIKCYREFKLQRTNPNSDIQLLRPLYSTASGEIQINGHCWRDTDSLSRRERAKFRHDVFHSLILSMITVYDIDLVYIFATKEPMYDDRKPRLNYNDASSFIWQITNLKSLEESYPEYNSKWFTKRKNFIAINKEIVKIISPKRAEELGVDLSKLFNTSINEIKIYPFLFQDKYGSMVSAVTEESIIKLSDDVERPFPFCSVSNFSRCDKMMHLHEVLRLKGYDDDNFYLSRKLLTL